MTDRQLNAIARLAQRAGTPHDIQDLLKNPLIETGSREWASSFIDNLIDARWAKVKEAIKDLESNGELKEKLKVAIKNGSRFQSLR